MAGAEDDDHRRTMEKTHRGTALVHVVRLYASTVRLYSNSYTTSHVQLIDVRSGPSSARTHFRDSDLLLQSDRTRTVRPIASTSTLRCCFVRALAALPVATGIGTSTARASMMSQRAAPSSSAGASESVAHVAFDVSEADEDRMEVAAVVDEWSGQGVRGTETQSSYAPSRLRASEAVDEGSLTSDPTTVREVMSRPDAEKWRAAMDEEIASLEKK
jgi:hypothetical protein